MYEKYLDNILKNVLFSNIDRDGVLSMLNCLRPDILHCRKNSYIAVAGDDFKGLGIVLSGEGVISRENAAGNRVVISYLSSGDMFGEMIAFSSRTKWHVNVKALTDCDIMVLSSEKIVGRCSNACSFHQSLITNLLMIISEKALELNKKLEYLSIKSMRGKISSYLLEQRNRTGRNSFILPLKREELADYLNVSRPSMSRELGRMRDEGIIDFHRSAIKIKDMEALKRMVEF
jgi:CRP-like cAMP-binding protein